MSPKIPSGAAHHCKILRKAPVAATNGPTSSDNITEMLHIKRYSETGTTCAYGLPSLSRLTREEASASTVSNLRRPLGTGFMVVDKSQCKPEAVYAKS